MLVGTVSEFMCASVLLYLEHAISLELSLTSGFVTFLFPLLHRSEPGGEGCDKDIPFSAKYVEVCHSLHYHIFEASKNLFASIVLKHSLFLFIFCEMKNNKECGYLFCLMKLTVTLLFFLG